MLGKIEKAVFTTVEVLSCEAHEGRFMCQERPRNQFSPLRLVQACLGPKNVDESSFNHCACPAKPMPACFSGRNDRESSFLHCRGIVKLV